MKSRPLEMLTPPDWELLRQRMRPISFRRGAVVLQEGVRRRALFIVRSGSVRVERAAQGRALVLSQLGAGEILGEIGFVEEAPASASVVAQDACTLDVVEGDALQALIAAEPGFAARFYHSLAISLARRTRAADLARLASAGTNAAAQVNRFHMPRIGNLSARQIPPALGHGLEAFERAMLAARLALRNGAPASGQAPAVSAACDDLVELLRSLTDSDLLVDLGYSDLLAFRDSPQLEAGVGDCVFRETFATFSLSATMARCHAKPRGFPDDFETMALILGDAPEGDDRLGPLIDRWFLGRPLCASRRAAVQRLRTVLDGLLAGLAPGAELRVASLASGAAAELFEVFGANPSAPLLATCVDLDDEALLAGARRAETMGLGQRIGFVAGNVVPDGGDVAEAVSLLAHDVVYALGLCEYLGDEQVVALLDLAWSVLAPGGSVVVTNLAVGNPDREVMIHLLDWQAHHRTEAELRSLFERSGFAGLPVELSLDPLRVTWLARCTKVV